MHGCCTGGWCHNFNINTSLSLVARNAWPIIHSRPLCCHFFIFSMNKTYLFLLHCSRIWLVEFLKYNDDTKTLDVDLSNHKKYPSYRFLAVLFENQKLTLACTCYFHFQKLQLNKTNSHIFGKTHLTFLCETEMHQSPSWKSVSKRWTSMQILELFSHLLTVRSRCLRECNVKTMSLKDQFWP